MLRGMTQPQVVRRGSRIQRTERFDSSGLRRREFGDSRLRSKLGGSRLRRKEHRLSRPEMRKLNSSRL